MAINNRGFALLIAVIFMSVMLSFGLALGSLGYKQQVLASSAIESQYAFYAADAGLECVLYGDQQQNLFAYANRNLTGNPTMTCNGQSINVSTVSYDNPVGLWVTQAQVPLNNNRCSIVTVYKYNTPQSGLTTYIFSQGFDVPCATATAPPSGARFVTRGITARY